jgi:acetyl esterase/lipase
MPNPDNTKWIGMVLGREITPGPPMESVDEIPGRRSFWDVDAMQPLRAPALAATHDVELRPGLRGELCVPEGDGPFPGLLYLHGGWWIMWSAAHVRRIATRIAERGFLVLNLDYRLAPEHPFPAAVEDAAFAARWLRDNAGGYGGDPARLLVGGDSVGATLAATTILAADVELRGALLLYGVFDLPGVAAEPLTNAGVAEISTLAYLGPEFAERWEEPLVSPYYADVAGFPPCYLSCGDEDSLLSQSLAMARRLHLANVPLTVSVVQGADHGFVYLEHVLPAATPEVERILDWLEATA